VVGGVAAAVPVPGEAEQVSIFPVEVIGPGFAQPGDECLFRAVPEPPAVWPYSYQWSAPASGTDDFAYATLNDSGLIPVTVTVTDVNNLQGVGTLWVDVDPSNDPCGI